MRLDAGKILEISITKSPKKEILEELQKVLLQGSKSDGKRAKIEGKIVMIVTPNPEQIMLAQTDPHFRDFLNRADVALPDGIGVVWASKFLASKQQSSSDTVIEKVIPGIEFMENLVSLGAKRGLPVALIGGRANLAVGALDCLQKQHPDLNGWAIDGPEIRIEDAKLRIENHEQTEAYFQKLARRIVDTNIRMVFVGLGAPKQEYFIEKLTQYLLTLNRDRSIILMSVGGSFDEISGRLPHAPQWISGMGLKWLWRLVLEPWRIGRQFALVRFVFLVLKNQSSSVRGQGQQLCLPS